MIGLSFLSLIALVAAKTAASPAAQNIVKRAPQVLDPAKLEQWLNISVWSLVGLNILGLIFFLGAYIVPQLKKIMAVFAGLVASIREKREAKAKAKLEAETLAKQAKALEAAAAAAPPVTGLEDLPPPDLEAPAPSPASTSTPTVAEVPTPVTTEVPPVVAAEAPPVEIPSAPTSPTPAPVAEAIQIEIPPDTTQAMPTPAEIPIPTEIPAPTENPAPIETPVFAEAPVAAAEIPVDVAAPTINETTSVTEIIPTADVFSAPPDVVDLDAAPVAASPAEPAIAREPFVEKTEIITPAPQPNPTIEALLATPTDDSATDIIPELKLFGSQAQDPSTLTALSSFEKTLDDALNTLGDKTEEAPIFDASLIDQALQDAGDIPVAGMSSKGNA